MKDSLVKVALVIAVGGAIYWFSKPAEPTACEKAGLASSTYFTHWQMTKDSDVPAAIDASREAFKTIRDNAECFSADDVRRANEYLNDPLYRE